MILLGTMSPSTVVKQVIVVTQWVPNAKLLAVRILQQKLLVLIPLMINIASGLTVLALL